MKLFAIYGKPFTQLKDNGEEISMVENGKGCQTLNMEKAKMHNSGKS